MPFQPGDIIQDFEEPIIKCLDLSKRPGYCYNCFKELRQRVACSTCQAMYCNKACLDHDWKVAHGIECRLIMEMEASPTLAISNINVVIVRLISVLKRGNNVLGKKVRLYDGVERSFDNLHYLPDIIGDSEEIKNELRLLARKLGASPSLQSPAGSKYDYDYVAKMFHIWSLNSTPVTNEENTEVIGSALYLSTSAIKHSCRPNAIAVIDKLYRQQIRCINEIAVGQKPLISRISGIQGMEERKSYLKERYNFDCVCVMCKLEEGRTQKFDYGKFAEDLKAFKANTVYTDVQLDAAKEIGKRMETIFCQYDQRITNFYWDTLMKLMVTLVGTEEVKPTIAKVKEFQKLVQEKLKITYGVDHEDYKYCERIARRIEHLLEQQA